MKTVQTLDENVFRHLIVSVGELPTTFVDSMSYYEMIAWLVQYIRTEVVPAINSQGEVIKEIQRWIESLNLDQYVDAKLEEMLENGELATAIAQIVGLGVFFAYDTVADMAAAENLQAGCFAHTGGFYALNDGGGATYKIRAIGGDTADGQMLIALNDETLVAELIKDEPLNVKKAGVHGDGETDDTTLIQNLIDTNGYGELYFPDGTYLITSPLTIRSANEYGVSLTFAENATLKTNLDIDSLIEVGNNSTGSYTRYAKGSIITISGGILDATHTTQAIKITSNRKQTVVKDLTILNISTRGIYTAIGSDSTSSTDNKFINLSINGNRSANSSVGIYLNAYDDKLSHININGCKTGIHFEKSGHTLEDVHILGSWDSNTPTAEDYGRTKGLELNGNGLYMFTDIYIDTVSKCFIFNTDYINLELNNLFCYWWVSNASYSTTIFEHNDAGYSRFLINNMDLELPAVGTFKGIDLSNTNENLRNFFPSYQQYQIFGHKIANPSSIDINDYIFCQQIYADNCIYPKDWWNVTMTADSYYAIARVKNLVSMKIEAGTYQVIEATVDPTNDFMAIRNIANKNYSGVYSLSLCNVEQNADGNYEADLCVKANQANMPLNISITDMKGGIGQLFTYRNYPYALTSPTVAVEQSFNPV